MAVARMCWLLILVLAGVVHGDAPQGDRRVPLSRHDTVAVFEGCSYVQCRGLTSLCPDQCGNSGTIASFRIVRYLAYEKTNEYGDPQTDRFVVLIEDNKKNLKTTPTIRDTVAALRAGDEVLLSWEHVYLTRDGASWPERPVTRLEKKRAATGPAEGAVRPPAP